MTDDHAPWEEVRDKTDARVTSIFNGPRMRVTGVAPDFPEGYVSRPGTVRLEFWWQDTTYYLNFAAGPEVMRSYAEDIIAMCDLAQGRT